MASTTNKLKDPDLSEQEQDTIIGAFVRRHENELIRRRWEDQLKTEYGVAKQPAVKKRTARIRKIGVIILAIAASLLLILVLVPQFNQPTGEELLAAYVTEITIDNTRGGGATEIENLRRQVADAFNAGNYAAAVAAGDSLVQLSGSLPVDELNLGKAYLLNGNLDQAEANLRQLAERATDYTTEARYTLALSLLSQEKTAGALAELGKIKAADGAEIHQKARALLEKFE